MPIAPTYPGVYIEELPSGVRTITGVSTSVTAFLGSFKRGQLNQPIQLFSVADLERNFGALDSGSEAGYAVRQFFGNGGGEAWVVRVASTIPASGGNPAVAPAASGINLLDAVAAGTAVLNAAAASEGAWGDNVRLGVDYDTKDPSKRFNLTALEVDASGPTPRVVTSEVFRNLTLDSADRDYAVAVVNDGSRLVRLTALAGAAANKRPAQTGTTTSAPITDVAAAALAGNKALQVVVNGANKGGTFTLGTDPHATVSQVASTLQTKIRAADPSLSSVTISAVGAGTPTQFLRVRSPNDVLITFAGALATDLNLDSANVQLYQLGGAARGAQALPAGGQAKGADGGPPDSTVLIGSPAAKTGIHALDDVDIFNILCLPDVVNLADSNASAVITEAEAYCQLRRSFFILDVPQADLVRDQIPEIKAWLDQNSTLRSRNAALYHPRPAIPDPMNGFRPRFVPPSGTIAGLYARTDAERGVWKAPAGTDAVLRGVRTVEYKLTDAENGTLNPIAINCLRTFPVFGNVCWGARTLEGADALASEWKYIPVRRTALFLEESLYRGTKWVVFEPNDEPLWAQIRLNIGAFLHDLFRQGAFQGSTPREAYFVKCDHDTTTQTDINLGIVNILVGFAPLKPAEFVVIQIQQIAGQIET